MLCSCYREKYLSLLNFSFLPCLYEDKKIRATKSIEEKTLSLSPVTLHCTSAIFFFFLSARKGGGEDDKDYGKIYIKESKKFHVPRRKVTKHEEKN